MAMPVERKSQKISAAQLGRVNHALQRTNVNNAGTMIPRKAAGVLPTMHRSPTIRTDHTHRLSLLQRTMALPHRVCGAQAGWAGHPAAA
jgi:hypothetical protein